MTARVWSSPFIGFQRTPRGRLTTETLPEKTPLAPTVSVAEPITRAPKVSARSSRRKRLYCSPVAKSKASAPAATLGVYEASGTSQLPKWSWIRWRLVTANGQAAEPAQRQARGSLPVVDVDRSRSRTPARPRRRRGFQKAALQLDAHLVRAGLDTQLHPSPEGLVELHDQLLLRAPHEEAPVELLAEHERRRGGAARRS